jgi:hypothetical protein
MPAQASVPAAEGVLDGVVTRHDLSSPLPNVVVTLRRYEGQAMVPPVIRRSDDEGHFRFVGLPPGLYRLEATRPGFEPMVLDPLVVPAHVVRNEHVSLRREQVVPPKPTT